ncbi:MAG TPA: SDR family oxidoreductase [Bacteroidales bacterium]|nr:SDR family oxidoreductase [Bacteroidales bacterium]
MTYSHYTSINIFQIQMPGLRKLSWLSGKNSLIVIPQVLIIKYLSKNNFDLSIAISWINMNIIIIGGTRGIGKEVALYFAQDKGNKVLVTGRNENALKNLSSIYSNIYTFPLDLALFESKVGIFKDAVINHFKRVDILINMAGMLVVKDFINISTNEARLMMETNFFGPASVIREIKPLMQKGSHIVNISSMGGFQGSTKYKGLSYYSASKAALASLSECLAAEFTESGISVNCLALGAVQTEMLEEAFPGYKAPVDAIEMAGFISGFAMNGHKFINGKIIPVAVNNP